MDKIDRLRQEGLSNEDIFSIYTEYIKDEIERDLRCIYEKEPRLLDSNEPWVFKIDK